MAQSQLNFAQLAAAALNGGVSQQSTPQNDRPQAKVWMNVGMFLPLHKDDGTTEEVFVSMPKGVPFDTMEEMTARGNNLENNQKVETGNFIMKAYQEQVANLAPGESLYIRGPEGGLSIEFKRVKEAGTEGTSASGAVNPLLSSAKGMIKVVK